MVKLTDKERKIICDYSVKYSVQAAADMYGLSLSGIAKIRKKFGVQKKRKQKKEVIAKIPEVNAMLFMAANK